MLALAGTTQAPSKSPTLFDANIDPCFVQAKDWCGESISDATICLQCINQFSTALMFRPACVARAEGRETFPTELAHDYCGLMMGTMDEFALEEDVMKVGDCWATTEQ
jgi:hypothetical protein